MMVESTKAQCGEVDEHVGVRRRRARAAAATAGRELRSCSPRNDTTKTPSASAVSSTAGSGGSFGRGSSGLQGTPPPRQGRAGGRPGERLRPGGRVGARGERTLSGGSEDSARRIRERSEHGRATRDRAAGACPSACPPRAARSRACASGSRSRTSSRPTSGSPSRRPARTAVLHAYDGARPGKPPTFALEARVEDDELLVVVRDSGSGVLRPRGGAGRPRLRARADAPAGLERRRAGTAGPRDLASRCASRWAERALGAPRSVGRQGREPPSGAPAHPARQSCTSRAAGPGRR